MTAPIASNWRDSTVSSNETLNDDRELKTRPADISVPPVSEERPSEEHPTSTTSAKRLPAVTETTSALESAPTDSHALATQDHDIKGHAQMDHNEPEVRDLGWDEDPKHIPAPLVGGLQNEDLWVLVRRFNKQLYHVKETQTIVPGGLDLNIADEDEFSPDKLRSTIERLYMTVFIGLAGFAKHIARLRSWNERKRTTYFCAAYFIAWALNFLVPLFFTTLIVLIVYPPSRSYLFPPAPLALVDASTGGLKKPKAGMLGSHDSLTGAPEKHQGEAVEQEASNFVSSFAHITLSAAAGQHPENDLQDKEGAIDKAAPDPTRIATEAVEAQKSTGDQAPAHHDKTKQPMEDAMWNQLRPIMHIIGDIADGWERFANALSPTPPFPRDTPRVKLASLLAPVLLVSLFVTSAMFVKGMTFGIGFGFFGQPVMTMGFNWLNKTFPDWQKLLEIRNTILKGVPTNAQLTITLLRTGEANKAPIPPPPRSDQPPPSRPSSPVDADELPLDSSQAEVDAAIHPVPEEETPDSEHQEGEKKKTKHTGKRIIKFFKGATKAGVEGVLGTDHIKANIGSEHAKNRLGILPDPKDTPTTGPVDFQARYKGKKGTVYISTTATVPCISFTTTSVTKNPEPIFSVAIADIKEIRKIGGLGWKAKLVVGWAMDRQIADGLEIIDREGHKWTLTAIFLRDELFNRLVAMGGQKWESW